MKQQEKMKVKTFMELNQKIWDFAVIIGLVLCVLISPASALNYSTENTLFGQIDSHSRMDEVDISGPGLPPTNWNMINDASDFHITAGKTISGVPALLWSYGCTPTAAAMLFGYYDRNGYPNTYVGQTNNGVFPLTSVWGHQTIEPTANNGECPLSASHNGVDGRTTMGHVDDYYFEADSIIDPYFGLWLEHSPDSLGDFMGTNQYQHWDNIDGQTLMSYYGDNTPRYDPMPSGLRDGAHGMKLFAESRGYSVETVYNQRPAGFNGTAAGYTFAQYKSEIDNNRPVIIHVTGHSMLGVGYNDPDQIIFHNTWDPNIHSMTWGGSYQGMTQRGVTVFHLMPISSAPAITGITPPSGVNTGSVIVTITGTNFANSATVKLTRSGSPDIIATGVTVVSSTTITCSLPISGKTAGQYNVVVTNPDSKQGTLTNGFTITPPPPSNPTITSITPPSGPNTGSVSATIAGTNFVNGATVRLNGIGTGSGSGDPVHKGSITDGTGGALLDGPQSVFVSGNYAYVVGNSEALEVIDISNPANPFHKGSIQDGAGGALLNGAGVVFVSGNYAYVASYFSDALEVVDISNPANPVHKGSITNGIGGALLNGPRSVFVSGNYAYVASGDSDALEIVDVSNPANPVHKGQITNGSGGALLDWPNSVFVVGNYAYVASHSSDALEIVDVTNPANPVHKGSIKHGTGGAKLSVSDYVYVSGNYAYVLSWWDEALEIIDVSNPSNPVHKSSINIDMPTSVFVSGNYAYVTSDGSESLEIIDVSNPSNPVHKSSLKNGDNGALLDWPDGVFVSGNYAYVAAFGSNALEIVELTGGSSPVNIYATGVTVGSPTMITCTLPLTGMPTGQYDVIVTNPDGKQGILTQGFTVGNGGTGIGAFRPGTAQWSLDMSGNFAWDSSDMSLIWGQPGDIPLIGDWNGDGKEEIGIFSQSTAMWILDYNGNSIYDGPAIDKVASFGQTGYNPVVGDWDGTGEDKIGVEKDGLWAIDYNGNYQWDGTVSDRFAAFGQTGDIPVVGDWDNTGKTKIGSHKDGFWSIDYNGNYVWEGAVTDRFAGFGQTADKPVIGDWNGDGTDKIGMEINGFWATDYNGNFVWDGAVTDRFAGFGSTGDKPIVGDWDNTGKTKIGSFKNGFWAIDYNGDNVWNGAITDRFAGFGQTGDTPVVGKWS